MSIHTKGFVAFCIVALSCCAVTAQTRSGPDLSLLRPSDISYAAATEFARFLNQHGIAVKSIHSSKLNSFFRGVNTAAFFKTDRGILDVIFFPGNGAEKVAATERRKNQRYIYSFTGQPHPNPPGDTFNSSQPMFFLMHNGWFIVTFNEKTYTAVKSVVLKAVPNNSLDRSGGSVFRIKLGAARVE